LRRKVVAVLAGKAGTLAAGHLLHHGSKRLKLSSDQFRRPLRLELLSVDLHPQLEDPLKFRHGDETMTQTMFNGKFGQETKQIASFG
jgi:hypothetical protein